MSGLYLTNKQCQVPLFATTYSTRERYVVNNADVESPVIGFPVLIPANPTRAKPARISLSANVLNIVGSP